MALAQRCRRNLSSTTRSLLDIASFPRDEGELRNGLNDKYRSANSARKTEETALLAKLTFYDARDRFQDDIFLSSLSESSACFSLQKVTSIDDPDLSCSS